MFVYYMHTLSMVYYKSIVTLVGMPVCVQNELVNQMNDCYWKQCLLGPTSWHMKVITIAP